jgi:hypothetical protein
LSFGVSTFEFLLLDDFLTWDVKEVALELALVFCLDFQMYLFSSASKSSTRSEEEFATCTVPFPFLLAERVPIAIVMAFSSLKGLSLWFYP